MSFIVEVQGAPFSDSVKIARYPGNRQGAVSYTFDDNIRNQFDSAVPVLNLYNIKGTFAVIVGRTLATDSQAIAALPAGNEASGSWYQILRADSMGHEICNHSWSHIDLTKDTVSAKTLNHEINDAWDTLYARTGKKSFSFVYPFNGQRPLIRDVVFQRHWISRDYQIEVNDRSTVQGLNDTVNMAPARKEWVVYMIHGITTGFVNFGSTALLRQHFAFVNTIRDKVWVETFGNVGRYTMERDSGHVTAQRTGPTSATVNVTCKYDTSIFNQPLTIIIPAPGAKRASAHRQGSTAAIPAKIDSNRVFVDFVPNGAQVVLDWASTGVAARPLVLAASSRRLRRMLIDEPSCQVYSGALYTIHGKRIAGTRQRAKGVYFELR
jgi:peptidoglycan/xylan/chitin deacetylase (PgdA/CDA1 family)